MSKTLSNEEGELYSTTRVKDKELDGLRVKHRKATSQSQTELSEDSLCGAPRSDIQNQLPQPKAQEEKDQGRPETAGVSRSQCLKGNPEVQAGGGLEGGKSAGIFLEYLKIALLVAILIVVCLIFASSNKNKSHPITGYSGGLLRSGDSPDAKKTQNASGNSSKDNNINKKLLNRVNSLAKEVKSLKTQIQKLIKKVGTIKPPAQQAIGPMVEMEVKEEIPANQTVKGTRRPTRKSMSSRRSSTSSRRVSPSLPRALIVSKSTLEPRSPTFSKK